ncbi:MAG: HAMP domain-containing histidine kinase [Anaerolineae bacterium]|nr:HAMP domain-containing histidine kinase [Anaerolineae bacterium]
MSIRLRLTLLYSSILALTLVIFSLALYTILRQVVYNGLANDLVEDARTLVEARTALDGRGPSDTHGNPPARSPWGRRPAPRFGTPETFGQIINLDGSVVFASTNLEGVELPLSAQGWEAVKSGRAWREAVTVENQPLYIYSTPLISQGRITSVVQVARPASEQEGALGVLRGLLTLGTVLATLTAFGVGWVLAGAALRPINRLTQTARAIGAERNFDRRVEHSGPNDELGRLATTFNQMLGELQTAFHQTHQSLLAQRRFVADASHELRTPLTTIRGNLGLLQRQPPINTDDREAVLSDSVEETERLMRLVQSLLTLARADAGQAVRTELVAVQPTVEDVVRQTQRLAPDHRVSAEAIPDLVVLAERDMLKQTLLILLDNAVKFTPVGGAITVSAVAQGSNAAITVRDTGIGIAPEALPHIFTRFYRTDTARTGDGAGLGLSIAQSLVEAYHGAITVSSQVGQGSAFTIALPLAPVRATAD